MQHWINRITCLDLVDDLLALRAPSTFDRDGGLESASVQEHDWEHLWIDLGGEA